MVKSNDWFFKQSTSPLAYCIENEKMITLRIVRFMEEVQRNLFAGIGKP